MKSNEHNKLIPSGLYIIIAAIAIVSTIVSLGCIINRHCFISTTHEPLIHDIIEAKYIITRAYLNVEQFRNNGKKTKDINRVKVLLNTVRDNIDSISQRQDNRAYISFLTTSYAQEYTSTIADYPSSSSQLTSRINKMNNFDSLSSFSALHYTIQTVLYGIETFQNSIPADITSINSNQSDPDNYEEFKKNYSLVINILTNAERLFTTTKNQQIKHLKTIKVLLLIASIVMVLFCSLMFFRFERRRAIELDNLHKKKGQLHKREERYRFLYKNIPAMMHSIDRNGHILAVSNQWIETLGYTREEVVGKDFTEFLVDKSKEYVITKLLPDFFQHGQSTNVELQYVKKNGAIIDVVQSDTAEKDQDGNISPSLTILHDVTELHRIQKELFQSQKMEAIGTMAGGIAHDFNNILTIIIGNTQLALRNKETGYCADQFLEQILKASNRAKALVKQILSFSRQSEQKMEMVKPCDIIYESINLLRAITPATVEILSHCDDDNRSIMVDSTQFHQVLMNLSSNAIHAMNGKGKLQISGEIIHLDMKSAEKVYNCDSGNYFKLSIRDSGSGINEENLTRIFDPFFTTKEVDEGTGMGLSIVNRIVQSHGGYITVESELGKGSVFHLFFPACAINETIRKDCKLKIIPRGKERILFIDDEVSLVELGRLMLSELGYDVTVKTCSLDALETFKSNPMQFDLVITDQTMPYFTGTELSGELLKIRSDIPIILCTGFSHNITKEKVLGLGIREYILKPLDLNTFALSIRKVLDGADQVVH